MNDKVAGILLGLFIGGLAFAAYYAATHKIVVINFGNLI